MTSACAANPNIDIAAAFSFKERNEEFKEAFQLPNERDGIRISHHVVPHSRVFSGQWFEIWNEERVPQEPNVEQKVEVVRHTELVAECRQRNSQRAWSPLLPEPPRQQFSQFMHGQVRGINDTVGMSPYIGETLFFKSHSLQYRKMR